MTPVSARIARPLIEGLRYDIVVRDDTAQRLFPGIHPLDYRAAVRLVQTVFFDARGLAGVLYWHAFRWLRIRGFSGLAGAIARRPEER